MAKEPKPADDPDALLTRRQVAKLLGVSEGTIVNREKDGTLRPIKLGNLVRHRRADVLAVVDRPAGGDDERPS